MPTTETQSTRNEGRWPWEWDGAGKLVVILNMVVTIETAAFEQRLERGKIVSLEDA